MIFDGRQLALLHEKILQKRVNKLVSKIGFRPILVSVLIGENPASLKYLALKKTVGERLGFKVDVKEFPENINIQEVLAVIRQANQDEKVWGILVQLPLPKRLETGNWKLEILGAITPSKDVDCLTQGNLELLKQGKPRFLPATVKGILSILASAKIGLPGKRIVVVGAKGFVGQPLTWYFQTLGYGVVGLDQEIEDLSQETKKADILISCTGVPGLIKKQMVKRGAVVIDVGSPKGDVCFEEVKKVASFITPVPGGVGPMTVISLFENLLETSFLKASPRVDRAPEATAI